MKYFTPLESPAVYGGDERGKSLIPFRKDGVKAPSFLTGFTLILVAWCLSTFLLCSPVSAQVSLDLSCDGECAWALGPMKAEATANTSDSKYAISNDSGGYEDFEIKVEEDNGLGWSARTTDDNNNTTNEFILREDTSGGTLITGTNTALTTDVADEGSYVFGLWFKAPPSGSDEGAVSLTVTLTATNFKKKQGTACAEGECHASLYCVDGYCCNTACNTEDCQRCDSYSHSGAGTCGYVSTAVDPDNDCSTATPPDADSCKGANCSGTGYACGYLAAGEQSQPVCKRCSGSSYDPVNITDDTGDSEGTNICDSSSGTCYRCNGGSCTYQTASQDLWEQCSQGSTSDDGCASDNCIGDDYACGAQTSGDGGCPVCGTCNDSDIACEYYAIDTHDDTGCTGCNWCDGSGNCLYCRYSKVNSYSDYVPTGSSWYCKPSNNQERGVTAGTDSPACNAAATYDTYYSGGGYGGMADCWCVCD